MGLFDKITKAFEKKECDFCGGEIGLLGNRKLEDGNMCKACASKLSPFFDDRRHSTVEEIREQLVYREENQKVLEKFEVTRNLGVNGKRVLVDENMKAFVVTSGGNNWKNANPDVIPISQVTGCRVDVDEWENKDEIKRKDAEGKEVSFNPPRYKYTYHYNVKVIIDVNATYFNEIKVDINNFSIETRVKGESEELNNCKEVANDIKEVLLGVKATSQEAKAAAEGVKTMTCPFCGAATTPVDGKCEYCNARIL